jgi:hypothetical protein
MLPRIVKCCPKVYGHSKQRLKNLLSPIGTNDQGCHMVYFQTKNHNLGIFWRILKWKKWPFGIFDSHLVYLKDILYIFWSFGIFFRFGMLDQEKSGNPAND